MNNMCIHFFVFRFGNQQSLQGFILQMWQIFKFLQTEHVKGRGASSRFFPIFPMRIVDTITGVVSNSLVSS